MVPGIVTSAFSYAGQKCSAASRILVHERVAERLADRLSGAVRLLRVGDASDLETDVPPLIEEAGEGPSRPLPRTCVRGPGTVLVSSGAGLPSASGWYVRPTVVTDIPRDSPLKFEEIFGPLISLERVASVEDALDEVDQLGYALTGGLFCRDPATVELVTRRSPVGSLYVNRPTTGAIVGRQPFGGNRLSGSGAKAGGPDYLANFVDGQVLKARTRCATASSSETCCARAVRIWLAPGHTVRIRRRWLSNTGMMLRSTMLRSAPSSSGALRPILSTTSERGRPRASSSSSPHRFVTCRAGTVASGRSRASRHRRGRSSRFRPRFSPRPSR